jgi:hypothetical protein
MAKNEVKLKIKVDDNGNLKVISRNATKAAEGLERTGKSARSADRQLKGAAQASANGAKNFAKLSQGITGGLVPAYAAFAAQIFALSAAFNFLKRAADLENLKASQVSYAEATGKNLQAITMRLKEASAAQLGFQEAAQAGAIGLAKGFSSSQLEELAVGARKASVALGRSYEDTFDRLLRGVSKAEPELLDELGITLRLETATKNYAATLGKTAKELTTVERSQAVLLETQRQLNDNFSAVNLDNAVNPFLQAQKSIEKVVEDIQRKILPFFGAIAEAITANTQGAATAVAALAVLIVANITGLTTGIKAAFASIVGPALTVGSVLGKVGSSIGTGLEKGSKKVIQTLDSLEEKLKDSRAFAQKQLQGTAKKIASTDAGSKSATLNKLAAGDELTGQQKGSLKRALKNAEKEYAATGKVTKGIFADVSTDMRRTLTKSLKNIDRASLTTFQKFKRNSARFMIKGLKATTVAAKFTAKAIKKIGMVAKSSAKFVGAFAKATVVLGIVGQIASAFEGLINAPFTFIKGFINMISTIAKGVQFILNGVVKGVNFLARQLPDWAKDLLGIGDGKPLVSEFQFADNLTEQLESLTDVVLGYAGTSLDSLKTQEDAAQADLDRADKLEALSDSYKSLAVSIAKAGSSLDGTQSAQDAFETRANAISTSGLSSAIKEAAEFGPEAIERLRESLKDNNSLASLGTEFASLVLSALDSGLSSETREGIIKRVIDEEIRSANFAGAKTNLESLIGEFTTSISGKSSSDIKFILENINKVAESITELSKGAVDGGALAKALFGNLDPKKLQADIEAVEQAREKALDTQSLLTIEATKLGRLSPQLRKEKLEEIKLLEIENKLRLNLAEITRLQIQVQSGALTGPELDSTKNRIVALQRQRNETVALFDEAKRSSSDLGKILDTASSSFESNMISAFDSVIQGTSSVKDAFANMAKNILASLSRIIAEMLVVRLIQAALAGISFGGGAAVDASSVGAMGNGYVGGFGLDEGMAARNGGMFEKVPGYATGGISKGRQAGYPAILHGTEAVVPLPNGKEIPVQMMNGGGQNNNVVVNVNVDSEGNAQQDTQANQQQGANLGNVIAAAVQKELLNQKRSGGILNPYGVA